MAIMTMEAFITEYEKYLPDNQERLLKAAAAYYQTYANNVLYDENGALKEGYTKGYLIENDFFVETLEDGEEALEDVYKIGDADLYIRANAMVKVTQGDGGAVGGGPHYGRLTITLPPLGENGLDLAPVAGIPGKPEYENSTFMIYDTSVAVAHESGHLILGFLGMAPTTRQELPNAVLASLAKQAISRSSEEPDTTAYYLDIADQLREYFGLDHESFDYGAPYDPDVSGNHSNMLDRASLPDSSFENEYNENTLHLYEEAGLNIAPDAYRVGYISHPDRGAPDPDEEWKTYGGGTTDENTPGRRDNLSKKGIGIAWLGNKHGNTMIIGSKSLGRESEGSTYIYKEEFDNGGNDYIDGGAGNDIINGGKGNDTLYGGSGFDTYQFLSSDKGHGHDTIIDSDGNGEIKYNNITLSGGKQLLKGSSVYQSADEKFLYIMLGDPDSNVGATLYIRTPDGLITVNKYHTDELTLTLTENTDPEPTIDNTILGDRQWIDFDPSEPGIQPDKDELGNPIIDPGAVEIMDDTLRGGAGNDSILSGGGEDRIVSYGGDDFIQAGPDRDIVRGEQGDDIIEGGADTDILLGGEGNDFIFADQLSDLAAALNSNDTVAGDTRDWLTGSGGDDLLVGSTGQNGLSGGAGVDQIYAGLSR